MGPVPGILPSFLCLTLTSIITCADVPLRFLSEPLSAVQVAEGQVELRCAAEPPSALLSWLFNGQQLDGQRLAGAEVRPGSLSLLSLQPLHGGRYQCVASTAAGAIISRSAYVSLAGLSDFGETARETVMAEEGGAAHIECHLPKSNPPALPRYRVQGKWLEHSTDNFLILPSGNLQIVSVSAQDRGTYKCGAMNPVTRETKVEPHGHRLAVRRSEGRTPVRILYPRTPLLLTVVQPDSLTLECVVSGSPAPTVHWTKGGRSLALSGRRRLLHSNLVLDSTRETDAGDYQCIAETEAGELVMANYTVRVLEPAYLLRGLSDQSLPVGSTVRFTCASRGNPAPNITWFHNAAPLLPSPRHQLSGARLRIAAVTHQDQGVYQCLADNGIGSAQSAGRLIIQSGHSSKPVITSPPSSSKVAEGDFVALSCNASGRPPPLIRWYDSQGPISSHPAHLLRAQPRRAPQAAARAWSADPPHLTMSRAGSSSLYIQAASLGHSGRYVCEASNELGSVQAEAFLTVVPFESSTVGVAGEAPPSGGGDLVQSDEGEGGYRQEAGHGEDKATPTERTSADPPPEAPIILSAPQTLKPDMYDLVWRPGRDWGTPINAYFVKYRKLDDGGNMVGGWYTVRVPGSENELRLTELEPSSLYEVLMVARSQAGEGQAAMLTFRTSKERPSTSKKTPPVTKVPPVKRLGVVIPGRHSGVVPEAPDRPTISMATETSVYVTWIPRANGGSPITAFRVEYRRLGRSTEWGVAADSISPSKLSVEVRSLEPGASYKFRVVAVNTYGESPHSAPSRPYSVAGFSGRFSKPPITGPHIAYTEAVSDTQIMLKWTYTSSSNNNTPIQGFYIYYRPTDSDNDSDYKRDLVEGMKQWHLISHLQPETSYDIKMQCFNEGGESEYSNVMICETRVKRAPGASDFPPVPPKDLATPPSPSERGVGGGVLGSSPRSSDMLYLIVGSVLGVMVLILLVFIAMCLWKNRQQNALHKYDPPGYLYQGVEMSAHMLEYTTLPRTGRINGSLHALSNGCPHLHLKVGNGGGLNGGNGLYPGLDGTLEYEHPPHHLPNGGGMYSALPQSDPSECLSCRNCRNNNSRCFSKTNGTLPIMHHVGPCRQDNLEMVPLSHVTTPPHCDTSAPELPECHGEMGEEGQEPGEDTPPSLSQHPCCQLGELHQQCQEEEQGEDEPCMKMESPVFCWEPLSLPPLDCNEKTAWISAGTAKDSSLEGFIQAQLQET